MFEKDSLQDLLLRGFSREYILDKTGTDVGYHGNAMKKELKGVDRVAYKVEFVESNYTNDEICGKLGVKYEGCDINSELFEGYKKLYELIDGFKPVLHNNDSANQLVVSDADAVITCPPYKNIEVYSDNGAENLSDEEFAAWWGEVVKNCSISQAKVFAVQTNQACRSVFADALAEQGW